MNLYKTQVYNSCKDDILSKYPEEDLFYHSSRHIRRMADVFSIRFDDVIKAYPDRWQEGFSSPTKVLDISMTAILFHDIVYVSGANDNEEKSFQYADDYLERKGIFGENTIWNDDDKESLKEMILYTKIKHNVVFGSPMQKLIHDADWIAFCSLEEMTKNDTLIAREALRDGFSLEEVKINTIKFLESLQDEDIYETSIYRKYNTVARSNIKQRLKMLQEK